MLELVCSASFKVIVYCVLLFNKAQKRR